MAGELRRFGRDLRCAPGQQGFGVHQARDQAQREFRRGAFGHGLAQYRADHGDQLQKTGLLAAKQIGLAEALPAPGLHLGLGDLADVSEGAGSRRHAGQFAALHQTNQSRPVVGVARSENMRRLQNHEGQSTGAHDLFGLEFASLVVHPTLAAALQGVFAQGCMHQMRIHRRARGVDEGGHTGLARGLHQVRCTADIGARLRGVVRAPGIGIGGGVEDRVHAGHGGAQALQVGDIATHRLRAQCRQRRIGFRATRQGAHLGAVGEQFPNHVLPQESGTAGNQNLAHE